MTRSSCVAVAVRRLARRGGGYRDRMKVTVVGATGNLGTAAVKALSSAGHEVLGVARRSPVQAGDPVGSVTWLERDVSRDDLAAVADADAVVHLAWRFQPTRDPEVTWEANAVGTHRLLDAVVAAGTPTVVCASSIAAYSPATGDDPVDEGWPTDGTSAAAYCREKAYVERLLDAVEAGSPSTRVVRLRPAFVFQRVAASEQRRIFGGPFARPALFGRGRLPVVPLPAGLRFQAVHAADVAAAVVAAVEQPVDGPVNLAGPGLLGADDVARLLGTRTVEAPPTVARTALAAAYRSRLAPAPPELFDAFMRLPVLSTDRARSVLGWRPQHTAGEAVEAFLSGARMRAGSDMPPLHP
jgi:UDP-glucose 4-epimerase